MGVVADDLRDERSLQHVLKDKRRAAVSRTHAMACAGDILPVDQLPLKKQARRDASSRTSTVLAATGKWNNFMQDDTDSGVAVVLHKYVPHAYIRTITKTTYLKYMIYNTHTHTYQVPRHTQNKFGYTRRRRLRTHTRTRPAVRITAATPPTRGTRTTYIYIRTMNKQKCIRMT